MWLIGQEPNPHNLVGKRHFFQFLSCHHWILSKSLQHQHFFDLWFIQLSLEKKTHQKSMFCLMGIASYTHNPNVLDTEARGCYIPDQPGLYIVGCRPAAPWRLGEAFARFPQSYWHASWCCHCAGLDYVTGLLRFHGCPYRWRNWNITLVVMSLQSSTSINMKGTGHATISILCVHDFLLRSAWVFLLWQCETLQNTQLSKAQITGKF